MATRRRGLLVMLATLVVSGPAWAGGDAERAWAPRADVTPHVAFQDATSVRSHRLAVPPFAVPASAAARRRAVDVAATLRTTELAEHVRVAMAAGGEAFRAGLAAGYGVARADLAQGDDQHQRGLAAGRADLEAQVVGITQGRAAARREAHRFLASRSASSDDSAVRGLSVPDWTPPVLRVPTPTEREVLASFPAADLRVAPARLVSWERARRDPAAEDAWGLDYQRGFVVGWRHGAAVGRELAYRRGYRLGFLAAARASARRAFAEAYPAAYRAALGPQQATRPSSSSVDVTELRVTDEDGDGVFTAGEAVRVDAWLTHAGRDTVWVPLALGDGEARLVAVAPTGDRRSSAGTADGGRFTLYGRLPADLGDTRVVELQVRADGAVYPLSLSVGGPGVPAPGAPAVAAVLAQARTKAPAE